MCIVVHTWVHHTCLCTLCTVVHTHSACDSVSYMCIKLWHVCMYVCVYVCTYVCVYATCVACVTIAAHTSGIKLGLVYLWTNCRPFGTCLCSLACILLHDWKSHRDAANMKLDLDVSASYGSLHQLLLVISSLANPQSTACTVVHVRTYTCASAHGIT